MKRQSRLLAECTAPEVRAQIDRSPKVIVPAEAVRVVVEAEPAIVNVPGVNVST